MTIFLPKAIEEMKDKKNLEENNRTSIDTQLVDVEYDDPEYSEQTSFESNRIDANTEDDENANEFREYSVDLWNGSPYIPHYESFKDDNLKPNQ